jgi:CRP-like cAMP-binding protein
MEEIYTILIKCPLFTNIKETEYKGLLSCVNSYTKGFKSNEYILLSGDEVNYVRIVLSGSLELIKENLQRIY